MSEAPNGTDPNREAHRLVAAHLREHDLMSDEHRRLHEGLLREIAGAATALDSKVRDTAAAFDAKVRDATNALETRVKEVADLHWSNHRVEHETANRAVDKVEANMTDKFASVNEFRDQQRDIIAGFMPRTEYDAAHVSLVERVERNQNALANTVSRDEFTAALDARDGQLDSLNTFRDQAGGKDRGQAPYLAVIFAVVGSVAGALILHFITVAK